MQKRAVETQEMANTKRRLAIEETELIIREKELLLKQLEIDRKLSHAQNLTNETLGAAVGGVRAGENQSLLMSESNQELSNNPVINECSWPNCTFC